MSDHSFSASSASGPHPAPGGLAGGVDAIGDDALQAMHARLLREREEPSEGFSIIQIVLIFVGCVLTYLPGIDLATHAGGFQWNVYDFNWKPGSETSAPPDLMKIGARVFKEANCANCHGPEGAGQPGTYPPLAGSPWPVGNPERPIRILLAGMTGNITVNGNAVSNGTMPNVGRTMSDLNVAAVLTYVRASFGNHDGSVDPGLVAQIRSDVGSRGSYSPEEILAKLPLGVPAPALATGTSPAAGTTAGATSPGAGTAPMGASATAKPASSGN